MAATCSRYESVDVVPLELLPGRDDSKSYLDITSDPNSKRPEYYLTLRSINDEVRDSLGLLSERERDVLMMRFGIDYEIGLVG